MKKGICILFSLLCMAFTGYAQFPTTRQACLWPFAQHSIWNMPIGADAEYVAAEIGLPEGRPVTVDEDILILSPTAPKQDVFAHDAGWSDRLRCESILEPREILIAEVPIPEGFSTDPNYLGLRPNHSAAILRADGRTLVQTQPFHICGAEGRVVSQFRPGDDDLFTGDGIRGAHGGSGMSSIGGTLRVGELIPDAVIRHALKVNLYAKKYLAYTLDGTAGYRWPAIRADGYANDDTYGGGVPALEMGALLALLPNFDLDQLRTIPAKILGQALKDYGAYVVDDTAWDVFAIATEWGPAGRVVDEFKEVWGFDMEIEDKEHPWAKDMALLFTALHVVDNNSPNSMGGGGTPRQPLAPPFDLTNTSLNEQDLLEISVFPNPTKGKVQLEWGSKRKTTIKEVFLWGTRGRSYRSWQFEFTSDRQTLQLELPKDLANGLYFLEIRDNVGKKRVEKIMISR